MPPPFAEDTTGTFGSGWPNKPAAPPQPDEFGTAPGTPGYDPNSTGRDAVLASVDAARSARASDIASGQGHPSYVATGFTGNMADRLGGAHDDMAASAEQYHNMTARQQAAYDKAHAQVETADFIRKGSQIDPNTEDATAQWMKLAATHTGATGEAYQAFNSRFFEMHNQHLAMTGKGWADLYKGIEDQAITANEVILKPDGSPDFAKTKLLIAQRTGVKSLTKLEAQAAAGQARLDHLYAHKPDENNAADVAEWNNSIAFNKGRIREYEHAAAERNVATKRVGPEPDKFNPGTNTPNPAHEKWEQSSEPVAKEKGPSQEMLATAAGTQVAAKDVVKKSTPKASAVNDPFFK